MIDVLKPVQCIIDIWSQRIRHFILIVTVKIVKNTSNLVFCTNLKPCLNPDVVTIIKWYTPTICTLNKFRDSYSKIKSSHFVEYEYYF